MPHFGPTAWQGSTRRATLPRDWPQIRRQVAAQANGMCQFPACGRPGNEADHIDNPYDHRLSNLQWLCNTHHTQKTLASQRTRRGSEKRPRERHPGITGGNHGFRSGA